MMKNNEDHSHLLSFGAQSTGKKTIGRPNTVSLSLYIVIILCLTDARDFLMWVYDNLTKTSPIRKHFTILQQINSRCKVPCYTSASCQLHYRSVRIFRPQRRNAHSFFCKLAMNGVVTPYKLQCVVMKTKILIQTTNALDVRSVSLSVICLTEDDRVRVSASEVTQSF